MKWRQADPKPGDPVRAKVSFYYHYGIFVSESSVIQFGLPDDPGRPGARIRVLSTDVYTFLHGGTLEVGQPDRTERKTLRPAGEVIAAAQSRIGEGGYDLLQNNCEHFIYACLFGTSADPISLSPCTRLFRKPGKHIKE